MPTYEYECNACGHAFDAFQKISDKPLTKCPKCGKKVRKLISAGAGIIFKGPGFYATDYRKKTGGHSHTDKASSCPKAKEGCNGCSHSA